MPEDRLQPSLLDLLTDDEPRARQETRDRRVLSMTRYREAVIRDLVWLLNTGPLEDVQDLTAFPHVARSVVNFGLSDLAGRTASGVNAGRVEQLIHESIRTFEPRILEKSIEIRVVKDKDQMNPNAVRLEVRATLWAQPVSQELLLRTDVDFLTGAIEVQERAGPQAKT